jgi:hypothetical protein
LIFLKLPHRFSHAIPFPQIPPSLPQEDLILMTRQCVWLKVVRLHKYAPQLVGSTLSRLPDLSLEELSGLGLTAGASKKLLTKAEDAALPWPTLEGTNV